METKYFCSFYYTVLFSGTKKCVRLNCQHFLIVKIPSNQYLQQIRFNHLSYIDFEDLNFCKKCTQKPYSFLVIDATLASDNALDAIF